MKKQNAKGFTLIELLVVIAILGLIAAVILVSLNSLRSKARDAKRVSDINQVSKALEIYFANNGTYPPGNTPSLEDNWYNMYNALRAAGYAVEELDLDSVSFELIPVAHASWENLPLLAPSIMISQDPFYPTQFYAYVTSSNPPNGGYRLRTKLENPNHPALGYGLDGVFVSNSQTTGNNACDKSLGYYCVGNVANNQGFVAWY